MARRVVFRVQRAGVELGGNLRAWRKLQGLTIEQVAERAGLTRQTVGRLERGEITVGLDVVLNVARALGVLETLVSALDPHESPLGRARADQALPKRVRP